MDREKGEQSIQQAQQKDQPMNLRRLRLRMGWTSSDLARRLGVALTDIEAWEGGRAPADSEILNRIEFLFRQAELCSDEVKSVPQSENELEEKHLGQIHIEIV